MGDLEFLKGKADSGDLVFAQGSRSTTNGVVTSYTPASGKTFYLAGASFSIKNPQTVTVPLAQLFNDTTKREEYTAVMATNVGEAGGVFGHFVIRGDKLVGDGAKVYKIDAAGMGTSVTIYGTIFGWIENT